MRAPDLVARRRVKHAGLVGRRAGVDDLVACDRRALEPPAVAGRRGDEQALLGAHEQAEVAAARAHVSRSRGISSTRLQGGVRRSSWASISSSQAVAQAPDEPGTQKM